MGPADVIVENIIAQEIGFTLRQSQYFQARAKVGAVVVPAVYQPVIEPAEGRLIAIFVEPGAAHLVFQDEIAPVAKLDSRYREIRRGVFGRTHDVESVEFIDGQISFPDASSGPFNLYETSFHFKTSEAYQAAIYSNTWNHLMSAGPQWYIALRGGYQKFDAPVFAGGRQEAEQLVDIALLKPLK